MWKPSKTDRQKRKNLEDKLALFPVMYNQVPFKEKPFNKVSWQMVLSHSSEKYNSIASFLLLYSVCEDEIYYFFPKHINI